MFMQPFENIAVDGGDLIHRIKALSGKCTRNLSRPRPLGGLRVLEGSVSVGAYSSRYSRETRI